MFRNNESILVDSQSLDYTIYLIDISEGVVADMKEFKCDKINLSYNQGLSLCNSRLAVLSLQQQTIHLFDIGTGSLVLLQEIGRFCYPDDAMQMSASVQDGMGPVSPNSFNEKCFTTLKHRLMCFLLNQAQRRCTPTDRFPLNNFYKNYITFKSLRIAKMQLLDEFHLLLKYSSEEMIVQKQTDPSVPQHSLYVVYNITATDILSVHENNSTAFLQIYENNVDCFRAPVSHPLCSNTSSPSNNPHSKALHTKSKQTITSAKYGGSREATRRLLGQLPVCSQAFSCSPYLDLALFCYNDKWISPLEGPKPCGDNPVKSII